MTRLRRIREGDARGMAAWGQTRRPAEAGLTLIELMLAITLAAIMMAVVYGVVVTTVDAAERIEEVTAGTEVGPAIVNQIRTDLEAALKPSDPETEWFAGSDRKATGLADRDRLDLVASVVSFGAEDEQADPRFHSINEVGYSMVPSEKRQDEYVLYRREDFWRDEDPLKGGRLFALYDRVTHFNVEYWDGDAWQPEWSSKKKEGKLPEAVRVTLRLRVEDRLAPGNESERTFGITVTLPK